MAAPVILIFDIGKTNKKLLLFDEQYSVLYEEATQLAEITDEDGFACEDVNALSAWVLDKYREIISNEKYEVKAINFSGYGASFVYVDVHGKVVAPLYNYLKPYPELLQKQFYDTYGGERLIAKQTASPVLGNLNSGMQLYRLKYEKPQLYNRIQFALHLPQYLSFIITANATTDITSVGCHTNLWDFEKHAYHKWVYDENIEQKFAPLCSADTVFITKKNIAVGIGLHDSSAALIPYLTATQEPFVLISTGTWCISLNSFNHTVLTDAELQRDCLCYLSYKGTPVKASRLFAGYEHEQQTKRLAAYFKKDNAYFSTIKYDATIIESLSKTSFDSSASNKNFAERDLHEFDSYEAAYHQLMMDIMRQQIVSTQLVLTPNENQIFVDGGFGKNDVYMHLLAKAFTGIKVCAASVAQASALGAALVLQQYFGNSAVSSELIQLRCYS